MSQTGRLLFNKEPVGSLSWAPGRAFPNPWNFPTDKKAFAPHLGPLAHIKRVIRRCLNL